MPTGTMTATVIASVACVAGSIVRMVSTDIAWSISVSTVR